MEPKLGTLITKNTTYDIMVYGCLGTYETVACIRNGILSSLALLTALFCIIKIIRLHMACNKSVHQYFIFYCASLECVLGSIHWLIGTVSQLDFVLQYLKLIQFLVMCHYYWTLATRALRREQLSKRFLLPFLILACTYFTVISTLGIINVQSTWTECLQPYWLELSAAEFAIVQLFAVAGFYITRRLNEISTLDSVRWSQKRDLWCIVIVFEISAMVGFLYDITLQIVGDEEEGCSGIFLYAQELYTPIFVSFTILKLLLPIWVMLYVFQPSPAVLECEDLRPVISDDATYTSIFNEDQNYRQLYHPSEDYHSIDDRTTSPIQGVLNPTVTTRQPSNLLPITEETSSAASSQKTPQDNSAPKAQFFL
ncbi:hypothetical protein SNE40_018676 [Patella caerulea]|uniref:Uncharacterized protein n=2 Tax=Patella caerulea TaxID=87958 RepID=A0AAN8P8I2_PATCE